ncbi:flagellar motor protein MotB [Helicobacter cetorum]|uniref:Flagellar motor protein MotB n=1 Tax=Helicobacter cetorum (strain ATCC BAA-540 / CCUG 52418 / MIT 99-5656) TaxID=1163745 RepID=I0ET94_HELCM|nr:flagellar motor protein MotB [Helicobacter cetorum]AFI06163.1 flagellar motor protein MotB [Helicobacter cetorum MIT 99-5656]
MAKKNKPTECPAGEKWAVPYADFLSLLLALFIALYAISAVNKSKIEALKTEFIKIFNYAPKPETMQPVLLIPPDSGQEQDQTVNERSRPSSQNTETKITITRKGEGSVLEQIDQGSVLKLPSNLLFKDANSDAINQDMMLYIERIAKIIQKLPKRVHINVKGFTDDTPLQAHSRFKNHYELAANRAYRVMKVLIQYGVSPKQLSFSSYGSTNPIAPNDSVENRMKNNRVEIFFSTDANDLSKIHSILDQQFSPSK